MSCLKTQPPARKRTPKTRNDDPNARYREATSRNIGLLTEAEQEILRRSRVAIAGLGAVGGNHLLTLTRLGIGGFSIADPDRFEAVNLHRQAGAFMATLNQPKAEVMARMARDVNPDLCMNVMCEGIDEFNVGQLLDGADIVVDGIDFFEIEARRLLFREARARGQYVITSGPIGYGATLQIFDPRGMTFDEYFGITPKTTRSQRLVAFAVGATPKPPSANKMSGAKVDFRNGRGPALCSTVMLCAGLAATEVLRILLKRDGLRCVPHAAYFNPYEHEYIQSHASRGRRSWKDRAIRWLVMRLYPELRAMHAEERKALKHPKSA